MKFINRKMQRLLHKQIQRKYRGTIAADRMQRGVSLDGGWFRIDTRPGSTSRVPRVLYVRFNMDTYTVEISETEPMGDKPASGIIPERKTVAELLAFIKDGATKRDLEELVKDDRKTVKAAAQKALDKLAQPVSRPPRYDEVYADGVAALDRAAFSDDLGDQFIVLETQEMQDAANVVFDTDSSDDERRAALDELTRLAQEGGEHDAPGDAELN